MDIKDSLAARASVNHVNSGTCTTLKHSIITRLKVLQLSVSVEYNSSKYLIFLAVAAYPTLKSTVVVGWKSFDNLHIRLRNGTVKKRMVSSFY